MAVAHQAPLSMGFPRQEYWSGLPFPSPDLPDPGIVSLASPALAGSLPLVPPEKPRPEATYLPLKEHEFFSSSLSSPITTVLH